jgi:hypothetical protein
MTWKTRNTVTLLPHFSRISALYIHFVVCFCVEQDSAWEAVHNKVESCDALAEEADQVLQQAKKNNMGAAT